MSVSYSSSGVAADAEMAMIHEAHPECYAWLLRRIEEELGCDVDHELTPMHRRVLGEFLVGDENYRTLFLYYDLASDNRKPSAAAGASTSAAAGGLMSPGGASGVRKSAHFSKENSVDGDASYHAFSDGDDSGRDTPEAPKPQLYVVTNPSFSSYPRERQEGVSNDLLYFIRMEPEKTLVPENVGTAILWGTCRGSNLLDAFLRMLRNTVPTLLVNRWPTSIEKDVQSSLHRFMATMVEDVNRLKGRTALYVPNDLSAEARLDAHTDRELVQRYEATVIHWTRQIKEVVGEKDSSSSMDDGGPLEEIGYWRARARDLGNIRSQLNCADVSAIVSVLREAKSLYYLEPFLNLRSDIEKGSEEAFDNLRFLSTLIEPCEKLAVASPKEIPEIIPDLLVHAQLILFYSKNYKKDRFYRFLRMVSNEIIRRCSSKIDVASILNGNVEKSMIALEESVVAGDVWMAECKKAIAATNRRFRLEKGEKMDLDDSFLNEIDGFVRHRCQNLQEICKGQLQFGFKGLQPEGPRGSRNSSRNRNSSIGNANREDMQPGAKLVVAEIDNGIEALQDLFTGKLPSFSGNKGPEIESQLMDIQRAFKLKMEVLRHLDYDILDVKATKWVDDFRALKMDIDNLTMMMQQIITAALDSIATTNAGAEYIEAFYLVSKSEELLIQLDRSKDRVFRLFSQNLKMVQGHIQRYFDRKPPIFYLHPPSAGHGFWASNLAGLITEDYNVLRHCYYLPDSPEKEEALHLYDRLDRSLRETSHDQFLQWRARVPPKPTEYLDRYLLVKRVNTGKGIENPPLYDVNFAKELLLLFEEVRYWTLLGESIPNHVTDICAKEERLRVFRESVALVARAHNTAVSSLTKTELQLFSLRLQFLGSKFLPGLNKLWWNSQGIVEYFVKECRVQASKTQQIVDDYKYSNVFVDHHCRVVTDTLAIIFEKKRIYTPEAFMEKQATYREAVVQKLTSIHTQIVDKMYMLLQYFREDYAVDDVVRADWHNFVERVELKVEEALKTMVKRSLNAMERALPLESNEDRLDDKIFKLDVVITVSSDLKPDINPEPSVSELSFYVNETCKSIIGVVRGLPRVEEALLARVQQENEEELLEQGLTPIQYKNPHEENSAMRGSYFDYMTAEQEAILSLRRIHDAFESINEKVKERLSQTWQVHQSSTTDNLWTTQKQDRRIKQGWRLEDYRINMDHVAERREGIDKQDVFADVVFLQLDFSRMKDTFRAQCQFVISHYHRLLYAEARTELNKLYNDFQNTLMALTKEPKNLSQLGAQVAQCTHAMAELPNIAAQFAPLADKFALITNELYNFDGVDSVDVQRCENLPEAFEEYTDDLAEARKLLEKYKEQFRVDVETDLRALVSNAFLLHQQVRDEAPTKWLLTTPKAFSMLESLESGAAALRETEAKLQQGIEIFNLDKPLLDDLLHAEEQLKTLRTLWTLVDEWRRMTKYWKRMYFMELESEKMVEGIETVRREVLRLRRELERTDVWCQLKDDIDLMKKIIPIIDDLRTRAIRPRHWESLKVQLDVEFDIESEEFCLQMLLEAHMDAHVEFIANLAVSAREELKIETDLEKIATFWEDTIFLMEPYQGYHKIASVEEINATLAEHLALLSSMKMSRFVDNFRPKVLQWEQTLSVVTDTIEALLTVQTKWMYLENIFVGSEDIKRKLVAESKKFDSIHGQWLTIMSRLINDPNVIRSTRRDSLLEQLNTMNADLELIQKSLEGFLEERRRVFPRFYFLSNDDLLEILGHTKEPEKVQSHLRKCFEGLYQLSMKTVRNRVVADGMSSSDGESVPFTPSVQIEGVSVEVWLRRIETKMRETVQKFIIDSLQDLQENVYDNRRPIVREHLKAWVERNEGQALITSSCINWTHQSEVAILEYGELHKNGLSLQRRKASPIYKIYKKWKNMIKKYCYMVRQPQSRLQRNKLVALVTIEVHSRDILRHILSNRVFQLDDFEWSRQLRFYSETDTLPETPPDAMKVCLVRQTSAVVRYDYEYLGNSGRLVVTGLTDRAYMTLTTALQLYRGGLPQGPAGTGKTETVKDLGKAIGKYVMVFNCSDGLDYRSVGRMLSGIAQTGAWSCFDEFNRIEVEVLSVVAQQILSILSAVAEQRRTFLFEGAEIPLNVNCGLFVTMNPGYAGRSELPDNLKALLRPISMMVPDFALICEITLLSEGFEESEGLSKKVSILYELMEKQLSKQDHYDFSLRNIKAVLVQAGNLKRENFPGTESQLCLKAMKDMNLPKFVKEDVPLFLGMLGDLFPGVEPEGAGLQDLKEAAKDELVSEGLETNEHIITKTLHLWDTLRTRHGVMVVGRTGSGKTVTWSTLAGALKRLKDNGVEGPYEAVRVSLLNPKSVTMDELYGSYNQATREWKDGILSDLMRQICRDATDPNYKWLLFDGPVDTLWIESMNTVLDDNKMLTLNSGERISMNPTVSMLFEVQDLSQASPATVSRCGMVYFNYEDLGWKPYVMTWLKSRRELEMVQNAPKPDATVAELEDFIMNTFSDILNYKATECQELVPTTTLNAVRTFTKMFDALANAETEPVVPGSSKYQTSQAGENYIPQLKMMAMFCAVWAAGGSLTVQSRQRIDSFIREIDGTFPSMETVFEYFPDLSSLRWKGWEEHPDLQKPYKPAEGLPYHKQIVPTIDTVRYQYLITQLVKYRMQLVLVGTTGTGKSLVAKQVMRHLNTETYVTTELNFSAQTSAKNVQDIIEGRMEHKSKKVCNPPGGRRMICLIEDLNMPSKEKFGAQPPLELLRQWVDNGYWYDRNTRARRFVNDMQLLCCMTYGRPDITERLMSKLNVFNITFPSETVITKIFSSILENRFDAFTELKTYVDVLVKATVETYVKVSTDLLPIPSKSHYLFNMRDLSKVFQGIYGAYLESLTCKEHLVALWVHENQRVFSDRMNDPSDKAWFRTLLNEKLNHIFQTKWSNIMKARSKEGSKSGPVNEAESPIFVDFWDGEFDEMAKYKLVPSMDALRHKVEEGLENYNTEPGARSMNLVFFTDALEHLCRIHRIIRQPQGNALLVGLGGSGRASLTRLAAYLAGYSVFTIEIHKKYDSDRFHDDLRVLYKACGVKRQQKVFYFCDNQIMEPSFLEDLNNMLSSGEVPNLFPKDDLQQIRDDVHKLALLHGCRDTPDELYNFFVDQARQHLHLVISMSPAQKDFRPRLRQFPALVSCTSIDWFSEWPNDALREVGYRYLAETRENDETDEHIGTICDMFVFMHDTTSQRSIQMQEQIYRYNYVTPSSYLDLVRGFRTMLTQKRDGILSQRDKLANGMSKLEETKVTVGQMTEELKIQDAKLQEKSAEVEKATESIQVRQRIAEEQQTLVASEKIKIEQTKRAALADQAEAQADLDRAMPGLLEAQAALDSLKKEDINEMKSYKLPAEMIRTVMEAVQVSLHRKIDWDEAKKSLSEPKFLDNLKVYHITNDMTNQKLLNALEKYVKRNDFKPKNAEKVSKAAGGLCKWVIAIYNYGNIYKEVHPKIMKNENAEKKVRAQEEMLRQKEEKLQKLVDEVRQLEADLQANIDEKNRLEAEARETQDKLNRARIIVDGLEGERDRWTESIENFDAALGNLSGDTLLGCGYMSYAGAFTADFRQLLWQSWLKEMKRLQITMNRSFAFVNFLADPTQVRDWQQAGLPGDDFSCENGVIVVFGPRYPLMIDPQQQAIKWIKKMEKDNGLKVVDMKQSDFQKTVEYAVQFGCPLLLQDVLEEIDPILDTVMTKAVVYRGSRSMIKIGDNYIDYNEKFKLYITTRLSNPHYTPETCTKVCLLNFAVKEQGLEEQLLKIVVEKEKPELEKENEQLILDTAAAKKETKRLEDEILNLLSTSQSSLLENQRLIDTLQSAKITAANIKEQLRVAEVTSEKIFSAREQYRDCARRASILFFVLADLGAIDAMYQFALDSYIVLFQSSIKRSAEKIVSHTLEERVKTLNDWHTGAVYNNTCRGLFEHHKLLFSFHMTMRILQAQGRVNIEEYVFLMRGGQVLDKQGRLPNPAASWLSERSWDHILELEKLPNFHGIAAHFESSSDEWRQWFLQERPEEVDLPEEWANRCQDNIQRMIFVRCLRPDRVVFMVYEFIEGQLGSQFVEPPQFNLKDTFDESTNTIPLIFVLSAGVDPTNQLAALAQRERRPLKTLALGQGQGENAKRAIQECSQTGGWVFLANCHLMVSWLVELEKIIDDLSDQNPHREFRLWLSSVPTPQFPIGILQRAIKMTTEPPKGIKANMLRLYNSFSEDDFAARCHERAEIYRNLLYSLCFFHSVLLERRKFGTLGYNVVYDFTYSDFEVSENIIDLYVSHMRTNSVDDIPFVTIRYLIAEASYGGRVTDDWDRRVLNTYMSQYMCSDAVTVEKFPLASAVEYFIPSDCNTVQAFKQECVQLPITDPPEAFGQHANADISSRISESTSLLDNLICVNATLVRGGGGGGGGGGLKPVSQEDRCMEILASLEEPSKSAVPALIDYDSVYEATKEDRASALNTCLLQEIQRYNILLKKIQRQKVELRRAVKGEIVMSEELETIFNSLLLGRVPPPWTSAYPSMKPLASWSTDLVDRIEQMKAWGQRTPTIFWLSGFTYPTGFLKSLQQQQARTEQVSIDQYGWEFVVMPNITIVHRPRKGAYIKGIYLEGAGWNPETSTLCEPRPMELIVHMPVIHFKPKLRISKPRPPSIYECPMYMYPVRTGTRERPSYVLAVDLESGEAVPEHYTKRGTALLLSTDE